MDPPGATPVVTWIIYCFTHTTTGRRYIGLTSQSVRKRWNQHLSKARAGGLWHFSNALRKYGAEEFSCEVLEVCPDAKSAGEAEKKWIAALRSNDRRFGFNLQQGGTCPPHPVPNVWDREGHREKVSAAMKRHYNDPEFRAKMSKALKEAQSRPELRAKRSPMMRELWGRQDFRRQVEKAQAKLRADPEKVRKMTAGLRARNEEAQQQIHCRNGHPWAENRLTNSQGNRVCRACRNAHERERYQRKEASRVSAEQPNQTP